MGIPEHMFFFAKPDGKRLLAFLHNPAGRTAAFGIVYCHPFAEERNLSHAVAANAARDLAKAGIPVLRFDFSGCGDSEGELTDAALEDWLEEVGLAADVLKRETGVATVGYWGLRLGATLAFRAGRLREDAAFLLLWHPVPDVSLYMHQFLRQASSTAIAAGQAEAPVSPKALALSIEAGEVAEVLGYPIAKRLLKSFQTAGPTPWKETGGKPAALVTIGTMDSSPDILRRIADDMSSSGSRIRFDHVREPSFWDRYWCSVSPGLSRVTRDWAGALA